MIDEFKPTYQTIGQVAEKLGLIDEKTGQLQTHTIRYWETQFKQIKPTIRAGKRRYYSEKDFLIIKTVKFLLKDQGLTIKGVKKVLNEIKSKKLDENNIFNVNKTPVNTDIMKKKLINISKIIKDLKDLKNG